MKFQQNGAYWCQECVEGRCWAQCVIKDLSQIDEYDCDCKGTGWIFIPYKREKQIE